MVMTVLAGAQGALPLAAKPVECRVPGFQVDRIFALPLVMRAIEAKRLSILVVGNGSSQLPGPTGNNVSYPVRLQAALAKKLPGVEVTVATEIQPRRTSIEAVKVMPKALAVTKPTLVVWQTGTVDAMQSTDPDQFSRALDKGINIARSAGADMIFVNAQYSPRTESMIALGIYAENMRWAAMQHEVPLFDRFRLMQLWSDVGTFDLYSATKKLDMAVAVHDCIGQLLADLVIEAARTPSGR
ncbi:MAG: SGNH/GDSL hydrolase family protein [Pseudolabrys sp.]|nr:SGNH/GDSL hydrolase family protein [Pseudolabrys sp.]